MNILPILASKVCDLNTQFNWGTIGNCFATTPLLGLDLSWILILIFFVLMVLVSNLKMGVWYIIAAVLAWFLLVSVPGNDIIFVIWLVVSFLIPALILIPGFKKFIDR